MKLSWSHAVITVRDRQRMVDFYTQVLGFGVTDQGSLGDTEIVFLSQDPDEHHQLAMVPVTQDTGPPSSPFGHFAFRVAEFEEIPALAQRLSAVEGVALTPLSHGNTLSIYFNDPEGNGLEVFWDTPWHLPQPQGKPWDLGMNRRQALEWVEASFKDEPGFEPREHYYARRRQELA